MTPRLQPLTVEQRIQFSRDHQAARAQVLHDILLEAHSARIANGLNLMLSELQPVPNIQHLRLDPSLGCWAYALLTQELLLLLQEHDIPLPQTER